MMTKEVIKTKKRTVKNEVKKVSAEDVKEALREEPSEEPLSNKRIYVGPGKPGLITNTVYSGELPLFVKEMVEECPAIGNLMVKISEYPVAKEKVGQKGTIEYASAKKILEYFSSEGGRK